MAQLKKEFAGITGSTVDRSALNRLKSFRSKLAEVPDRIRNGDSWKRMNEFSTKQHERILSRLEPELIAELQVTDNDSAIQDAKRNLANDATPMTSAEQRIAAAAKSAESRLEREGTLSYFSPQERKWIASGETKVRVPSQSPEPTAESMRHALLREFATLPGFERTTPNTVVGSPVITRSRSSLTRKTDKMVYDFSSIRLTVNQVWRWKDREGKTAKLLDEGFECPFSHDGFIRPNRKLDDSDWRVLALMGMNPQRQQKQFETTPTRHVFVLTKEGYRSPTLRRFFAGQNAKQFGSIQTLGVAADIKANGLQKEEL